MSCLTKERLEELIVYDPVKGHFYWKVKRRNGIEAGSMAGSRGGNGYWQLTLDYKRYLSHRIAWFYMNGEWPKGELDHVNGDPLDNRWENIRSCTKRENNLNRGVMSNNRLGVKGVKLLPSGRYQVLVDNKSYGTYSDLELAQHLSTELRDHLHGEFARHV